VTVSDPLLELLRRAEADLPGVEILTADEVSPWPVGVVEALVQNGFLSPTTPGTSVLCDACLEDHWQEVEFVESPPGTRRAYIVCPEAGRVAVDTTRLNRWRVNLRGLAGVLGQLLGCREAPDELVASRLWRLGTIEIAGEPRDAFLVRGPTWPNAAETLRLEQRLSHSASSLLLTLVDIVVDRPADTSVVPLTRVLTLADNGLSLDLSYIEALLVSQAERSVGASYIFRKQGEYWTIVYEGRLLLLKDALGLGYIRHLLGRPGESIHVLDLVSSIRPPSPGQATYAQMSRDQLDEEGLTAGGWDDLGPALDPQAKADYRKRLTDIEEDIAEAERNNDVGALGQLKEERDSIVAELERAFGLRGQARAVSSSTERARSAVRQAVGSALRKMSKEDITLGRFLSKAIETGTFCSYSPGRPVPWEL
jgi:hypothetical protein